MPPTLPSGPRSMPNLTESLDLVAAAGDGFADEQLVVTRPIEVARIEQRHATLDRGVDHGDTLRFV